MKRRSARQNPARPADRHKLFSTMRTALILLGSAIALLVLILVLRPSSQFMNSPEMQRTQSLGVLRVGVYTDKPGFSFKDQGLEADLARALCKRIFPNLDPDTMMELIPVNAYTALPKLDNETIDVAIAMQTDTGSDAYAYSTVYFRNAISLLCRPGSEAKELQDQKIGLFEGISSSIASAEKLALNAYNKENKTNLSFVPCASYPDMCMALINGKVDLIAVPATEVENLIAWNIVQHKDQLGSAGYVAVSTAMRPSYALLMGLIIEEMQNDGSLAALIEQHDIGKYQPR